MDRHHNAAPVRDVVVIGASAGGIEPLTTVVRALPADLPAAVFVVVHTPPHAASRLPQLLSRAGALPAAHAVDGERVVAGHIYVARPDHHLLVRPDTVEVSRGPRENHTRPAIDPLFRSAARAFGPRVIGVILSGALYDGAAGLLAITQRGGIAIVQDAEDAMVPSMPLRALDLIEADMILPAADIGHAITRAVGAGIGPQEVGTMMDDQERVKAIMSEDFAEQARSERADEVTLYTCPDCGGTLWQSARGPGTWFQCHVGHGYGLEVLLSLKSEEVEAALWKCIRLLREKATLTRQSAARYGQRGNPELAARADEQAQADEDHAESLRLLLEAVPSVADVAIPGFTDASPAFPGDPSD
jgi:two-component system chemotaxis response regulator CheB